ncbi:MULTISPECIES: hypothetical protein [Microbacterium]|jgi:hypothetical protein|uniref:SCP-2 sterol transfer family protein n=1 Tax=Microbacterium mcarthurae TaxID=3035918 RepID=A0ABW9GI13_9MICO|nr:hypothetical protein [Microbacterium sp. ACRRU]MCG7418418.1 hypothetical protein [Microbacterium sp. ACRRU]
MTPDRRFEWGGLSAGRADFVTASEALGTLERIVPGYADLSPETGVSDGDAVVRLSSRERWAIVSTPGTRWFSVRVDTGHRVRLDDTTSSREEAAMLLTTFVEAAAAYVRDGAVVQGDRLIVTALGRTFTLTRPLGDRLRRRVGRR